MSDIEKWLFLSKREVQCLQRALVVFEKSLWQGAKEEDGEHHLVGQDKVDYKIAIELQRKLFGESK